MKNKIFHIQRSLDSNQKWVLALLIRLPEIEKENLSYLIMTLFYSKMIFLTFQYIRKIEKNFGELWLHLTGLHKLLRELLTCYVIAEIFCTSHFTWCPSKKLFLFTIVKNELHWLESSFYLIWFNLTGMCQRNYVDKK